MEYKKDFFEEGGKRKVKITFLDDNFFGIGETKTKTKIFESIDCNKIYEQISKSEPVYLRGKYIENFSMNKCREKIKAKNKIVVLNLFNASGAFFDSKDGYSVDFERTLFRGQEITFSETIFGPGGVNFHDCIFVAKQKNFRDCKFLGGKIYFARAQFGDGPTCFSNSVFGDCEVNFINSIFGNGRIDFLFTKFGKGNKNFKIKKNGMGDVLFSATDFGDGDVDFSSAKFGKGDVIFGHAVDYSSGKEEFKNINFGKGDVKFAGADFGDGKVGFYRVLFGKGDVDFRGAKFIGNTVEFIKNDFGEGLVNFNWLESNASKVSFRQSKIHNISFRNAFIKGEWDMRVESANNLDFSNATIQGNINFYPYDKETDDYEKKRVNIEKSVIPVVKTLNIIDLKIDGKIYINFDDFRLREAIKTQGNTTTYRQKRDQFRLLKENFRNLGQYDDEDKAYAQFMYHKIRAEEFELAGGLHSHFKNWFTSNKWNIKKLGGILVGSLAWIIDSFGFFFKLLVYEIMGKYGTSPFRVFWSMVAVVLGFSWMYSELPPPLNDDPSSLFHSVITFLTIGYGTNYANITSHAGKVLSGVEGFMGLFLMSYFTISFARKVLR